MADVTFLRSFLGKMSLVLELDRPARMENFCRQLRSLDKEVRSAAERGCYSVGGEMITSCGWLLATLLLGADLLVRALTRSVSSPVITTVVPHHHPS